MTEAPPRVRAVATVRTGRPERAGPAILSLRRRPGHLGGVHVFQVLVVEAVVAGVLVALTHGAVLAAGVAAGGAVAILAVFARQRGRWWVERALLRRRYRQRQRYAPDPVEPDPRLSMLRAVAPDLTVQDVGGEDSPAVGVADDGAGWFALAAVGGESGMRGDPWQLPLEDAARALAEVGQPGSVLQVVVHTVPSPSAELDPRWSCDVSYRELLGLAGPVPADRQGWVVVRLDARRLAEAEIGGPDESAEAPAVVAAMAGKIGRALRRAGVAHRMLDRGGLLDALSRSCDLVMASAGPDGRVRPREEWRSWHSGQLRHVSYWVRAWPRELGRARSLLDALTAVPASLTSVSIAVVPEEGTLDVQCLARVAAPEERLDQATHAVVTAARAAGARLFRLDGEQGPATYATAPTGGGVR
jgi:type VII secretion protein EccE